MSVAVLAGSMPAALILTVATTLTYLCIATSANLGVR